MDYFAHGYMMDGRDYGHGESVWGWILMLLVMGLLVLAAVVIVRLVSSGSNNTANDAMDTLKHRYAKGEITKKQFEEMKKDIK